MSTRADFPANALRASELARCPRQCAYRGLAADAREPDERTRRYFARGHMYGAYVGQQLEARFGPDDVERERVIPWPLGEGHADFYVRSMKLLIETKSTVAPSTSSPMFDMAVWQLKIYLRFDPEAEHGALYIVNPSSLDGEDVVTVTLTDDDIREIDAQVESVRVALDGGPLPDRVCDRPSQARGRLCPFAVTCFEGWEPDPAREITDPRAADLAARIYEAKQKEREHRAPLTEAEADRKQAEAELAELLEQGASDVGPFRVTRSDRHRESFNLKKARLAGVPDDLLDEFTSVSRFSMWTVDRQAPPAEDYGDVPF